jgi:hypothetical protein
MPKQKQELGLMQSAQLKTYHTALNITLRGELAIVNR